MPRKQTTKRPSGITPESFKKDLGGCVKKLRKAHRMTQTQFGEAINIAYYQISRYERGKDEVSIYIAMRICKTFNIAIEDFLHDLKMEGVDAIPQ